MEEKRDLRRTERRRSHINDPAPKNWSFRNVWVFGKHLPISWGIILCTLFLTVIGTLMVYSASSYEMGVKFGDSMSKFSTQISGVLLGCVAFFITANLDYRWLNQRKLAMWLMLITSIMLALVVALPLVEAFNSAKILVWSPYINNAHRWLYFGLKKGVSVQPSELFKIAVVIYLSFYMNDRYEKMRYFWKSSVGCLLVVGLPAALLIPEPNLSTTCLIVFVTFIMLIAGGMRMRTFFILMALGIVVFFLLAKYVIPNRWQRIMSFTSPFEPGPYYEDGYQLRQGEIAFGNGGWFGTGLGFSKQKHQFLPYPYSDFIFAIVGEELGFLRSVGILLVFLLLIAFGLKTALRAQDRFGCFLAVGLTSIMAVQVILNVLVVTGLAPTTGIPLPFFTSGGTNISIFLGSMGLLTSVSRRPAPQKEALMPTGMKKLWGLLVRAANK